MPHPEPERRTNAPPGSGRLLAGLTPSWLAPSAGRRRVRSTPTRCWSARAIMGTLGLCPLGLRDAPRRLFRPRVEGHISAELAMRLLR
jgi:hypothetical protein